MFGRTEPLDAEAEALSLLGNSPVTTVEIVGGTSDLRISFANGALLKIFNPSCLLFLLCHGVGSIYEG
jgi:hypothetical protein